MKKTNILLSMLILLFVISIIWPIRNTPIYTMEESKTDSLIMVQDLKIDSLRKEVISLQDGVKVHLRSVTNLVTYIDSLSDIEIDTNLTNEALKWAEQNSSY